MRTSITTMDDSYSTRHSSLILCYLDFIFLKAIPALKEKLNNIAANGMVIWKQSESDSHLQLVSSDSSKALIYSIVISTTRMEKQIDILQNKHLCKHRQSYAKIWFNQPKRKPKRCVDLPLILNGTVPQAIDESIWNIVHEQTVMLNMKVRAGKIRIELKKLLEQKNLPSEARKVWTEIDESKSEEELTTELRKLWYLKNSAK